MKQLTIFFILLMVIFDVKAGKIAVPQPGSHNLFAADLFHNLVEGKSTENILFSPLSLETALTWLFEGAEGKTAEDMRRILRLDPEDKNDIAQHYGEFLNSLITSNSKSQDVELLFANRMFVTENLKISPEFNRIAEKDFDALAENVNFGEGKLTAEKVNSWVEQKTHNKIKNLIDEKDIGPLTNIILANALYFKGKWRHSFNEKETKSRDFYLNEKEKVQVETMHVDGTFEYAELPDLDATALELPYNNSDMRMIIILPNKKEGLKDLESKLKALEFNYILSRFETNDVCVYLPKFRMEEDINVQELLEKVGLSIIFSDNANFSGIFDSPTNEHISAIRHKSFVEIDELGSEASGSTGAIGHCRKASTTFRVDHPFIFGIRSANAVHFAGHLVKF